MAGFDHPKCQILQLLLSTSGGAVVSVAYCREALGYDALSRTMLCHQNRLLPDLQDVCSDAMQRQSDVG